MRAVEAADYMKLGMQMLRYRQEWNTARKGRRKLDMRC